MMRVPILRWLGAAAAVRSTSLPIVRRAVLTTLVPLGLAYLFLPQPVLGCGPFETSVLFFLRESPEAPLDRYVQGDLGILQPTYDTDYLYAAYRQLAIGKFDEAAQKDLLEKWHGRTVVRAGEPDAAGSGEKSWLTVRNAVPGVARLARIDPDHALPDYQFFVNCNQDSFTTAAKTLADRRQHYGASSRLLRDWVDAQDLVFSNCAKGAAVPGELDSTADPLARADRAYQIAAAYFYSAAFDQAEAAFRKIAADSASPWHKLAVYLIARTRIRRVTLERADSGKLDFSGLKQADLQLESILADPDLSELHGAARRLRGFVLFRLTPEQRAKELVANLLSPKPNNLSQDLTDFEKLHGSDQSEITGWMESFRSAKLPDQQDPQARLAAPSREPFRNALEKWRKQNTLPWLIAALALAPPDLPQTSPDSADMLRAAQDLPKESPGYLSATYYRGRVLLLQGRMAALKTLMDEVLKRPMPPGTTNQFRMLRAATAKSMAEYLHDASLAPVATTSGEEFGEDLIRADDKHPSQQSLPVEAAAMLDRLAHGKLLEAARTANLDAAVRAELLNVGLTRSLLLDDPAAVRAYAADAAQALPELKPDLAGYDKASSAGEREFAGVLLLLHAPGMRPRLYPGTDRNVFFSPLTLIQASSFHENWWCSEPGKGITNSGYFPSDSFAGIANDPKRVKAPAFAAEADLRAGSEEHERLAKIPTAPNYFAEKVLAYAKVAPADPRVPEALHLAVARASKLGCTDGESKEWSRKAFELLHLRYPKSEWTKKTPYYY